MRDTDWWVKTKAAARAVTLGLMVNPLDPPGWVVDEAIRRAEENAGKACECSPDRMLP